MRVSIFSAPELIVTDLTHYLPDETTELIITQNCSMRHAALDYAYINNLPLIELSAPAAPFSFVATNCPCEHHANLAQNNAMSEIETLHSKSDYIVIFHTGFSPESTNAIAYCTKMQLSFSLFALNEQTA